MATITVSSNPSTTGDTLTVNFTTDATNISDILISKDGGSTYISATSFTSSEAVFNVSSWDNGTYNNCKLKCVYIESGGGTTDTDYVIKYRLNNATSSNTSTTIKKGSSYSTTIVPETGYTVTEIYCVMGGTNVSDSVISGNNINIPNVTGEIVISVYTKAIGGGEITPETLTISNIANITQTEKTEFYIEYSTNIAVAKHEVSWDGGSTFYDKTEDVTASGTNYRFKHDKSGNAGTYRMAIRVTDSDGNTKTSNIFNVTLTKTSTPEPSTPTPIYELTSDTVFDGTSKYVDTGVKPFKTASDYTIFLDFDDGGATQNDDLANVLHCVYEAGDYDGLKIYLNKEDGHYYLVGNSENTTTNYTYEDSWTMAKGQRNKIAIAISKGVVSNIVINGSTVAVNRNEYDMNDYSLILGAYQDAQTNKSKFWKGTIHTCKIWNSAFTVAEMKALFGSSGGDSGSSDAYRPGRALLWEDDFTGTTLNTDNWDYENNYSRPNEVQNYVAGTNNVWVENSNLVIKAKKESSNGKEWSSGCIHTDNKQEYMYGRFEAKIKIPQTVGSFPAFWTLGGNYEEGNGITWPYCGEIDIMEHKQGYAWTTAGALYRTDLVWDNWDAKDLGRVDSGNIGSFDDYHIYAMEWTRNKIDYYVDDRLIGHSDISDDSQWFMFHQPHYILLNHALGAAGGSVPSDMTEYTMYVDWVRVYAPEDAPDGGDTTNRIWFEDTSARTMGKWSKLGLIPKFNESWTNKVITWKSSDESIATVCGGRVDSKGVDGTCTITATTLNGQSASVEVKVGSGGSGSSSDEYPTSYTVTYNLNEATSSNNVTSVEKWSKYSTDITANNNYTIKSINVVMNGDDYSSKYVTNNKIDIPLVTGDIYITIVTETSAETQVTDVFDRYGIMDKNFYITYTTNKPVKEHFIQWGNSGFHDVTKTVKSFGNKHILLCDNVADKTWEAKVYDMEVICKDEADTYVHSAKFNLTVLADTSETFTITNNLSNAINGNDFSTVPKNSTYSTLIIPDTNYSINNITVTMGGVDISSSCVNNENINISQVTGNINITVSTSKIDPTIYTNPSFSVKDFKIILSENGHTEAFTASDGVNYLKYSNKKEVVADMSYSIPLVSIDTGSKFRINGLYPYNGGYMEDKTKNGDEYIDYTLLTDFYIPIWTYTNWNFSYGIKNTGIEDELLNKSIHNFNTALPAFNVYIDNTSTNTATKDSYSDSWFGQTSFMKDHFEIKINESTCNADFGGNYGDSAVISNKWISTTTHEIGHTVGFMDNPDHMPSLYSYNRTKDTCTYLQAPDIYTIKYLYIKTYGIDISKSQKEITAQATKLGLIKKANDMPMRAYSSRPSCQICFDYNYYDKNELENKSDVIVEGQLNFKEVRNINIGKDLNLEYNVYTISTNNVIKGELTNMELKIHVSEQLNIDSTNNYKLYLKQYDNVPCSLINPNQGIEKI